MEESPQQKNKNEVEKAGGVFGILMIVLLLAAGGIYFLFMQQEKLEQNQQQIEEGTNS
jgi:uncharacterized protein HemX